MTYKGHLSIMHLNTTALNAQFKCDSAKCKLNKARAKSIHKQSCSLVIVDSENDEYIIPTAYNICR